MTDGIIFRPATNSKGRSDVTGMFGPRADELHAKYGWPIVVFDNTLPVHRKWEATKAAIAAIPDGSLRTFVALMHGWPHGLQFGLTRGASQQFVEALLPKLAKEGDVDLVFLACSTGEDGVASTNDNAGGPGGEDGLADRLADLFMAAGRPVRVWAHTSEGRADINPNMRLFDGTGVGGRHVVEPFVLDAKGKPTAKRNPTRARWAQYLKDGGWAEFWTLTQTELEAKLRSL